MSQTHDTPVLSVHRPLDGVLLGTYPQLSSTDLQQRIVDARAAQVGWADTPLKIRRLHARRMRDWLVANDERVAKMISDCVGKTMVEALMLEVVPSIFGNRWYERHAASALAPKWLLPGSLASLNKYSRVWRNPLGVVGIIAPWNYPLCIPAHEIIPALLAGNTVVFKTAPETAPVGELIQEMTDAAGLPEHVFQHVIVDGPACGDVMLSSDGVDKLFFTGSVIVGKLLAEKAAAALIPISLELGGKDAMIVLEDAPLDRAVVGAIWGGMQNAGQSCAGVERLYVQRTIYDKFLAALKPRVESLRWNEEQPDNSDFGAICTVRQLDKINTQLTAALEDGARVFARTPLAGSPEHVIAPTVLVDVDHDMEIMREETFGPIIGVMPFDSDDDAVRLANDSTYGLTASVWSKDNHRATAIARQLRVGAVTINDHLLSHGLTETPWGGVGDSGFGRGHGMAAFEAMTQSHTIVYDWLGGAPRNAFWQPYSRSMQQGIRATIRTFHGAGLKARLRNFAGFLGFFFDMFRKK